MPEGSGKQIDNLSIEYCTLFVSCILYFSMSIVTKTGDKGETGLFGGTRVPKNNPRVAAYGDVDELNSAIGVLLSSVKLPDNIKDDLLFIQDKCFVAGGELATPGEAPEKIQAYVPRLAENDVLFLEEKISALEAAVPGQTKFILPGGSQEAALCFWVRTIARRAERSSVGLAQSEAVSPLVIKYLNRLSDYFFILGRFLNHQAGVAEIEWQGGR